MILFVFEGSKREPRLFEAIKEIFLPREIEPIICTYGCNIYKLYSQIKKYDVFDDKESVDTVSILKDLLISKGDNVLKGINPSDISEIFLFFDYDFHHHSIEDLISDNEHIVEMLKFFDDETTSGKLYINYPMIESIRYTKCLPDNEYFSYTVTREQCKSEDFKNISHSFSHYKSLDHLLLSNNPKESDEKKTAKLSTAKNNWLHLVRMNVGKAAYICVGRDDTHVSKDLISQSLIFKSQLTKYVYRSECCVSVLNSFPIFIYDYLRAIPGL
ncbi:hypothetical protein [Duncaniella freteri]|jgi:hypothetical protein|uniref:hypothetical protein n=2 Tax=Duncaniella freteri TaxID=2530391 RepID=UPI0032B14A33